MAIRELETDAHFLTVYLEIAWEPRFQPLFLENHPVSLSAQDDRGDALKVADTGTGLTFVTGRLAFETQVRLEAPTRGVKTLGLLQGNLNLVGPGKMLTFTFDNLAPTPKGAPPPKEIQEGVAVTLDEFSTERVNDSDRWKVSLSLKYPAEGPDFESFQSWLVNNEVYLEKKDAKERVHARRIRNRRAVRSSGVIDVLFRGRKRRCPRQAGRLEAGLPHPRDHPQGAGQVRVQGRTPALIGKMKIRRHYVA